MLVLVVLKKKFVLRFQNRMTLKVPVLSFQIFCRHYIGSFMLFFFPYRNFHQHQSDWVWAVYTKKKKTKNCIELYKHNGMK